MAKNQLTVENRQRDSKHLHRVWKTVDGTRPSEGDAESYRLELGSQDDREAPEDPKDPVLRPQIDVPAWAVAMYRKSELWRKWEDTGAITVRTAA